MLDTSVGASKTKAFLAAALIGAGTGVAVVIATQRFRRSPSPRKRSIDDVKDKKAGAPAAQAESTADKGVEEVTDEDGEEAADVPTRGRRTMSVEDLAEPKEAVQTGGCRRNEGPMAEWQSKIHTAHLAVGDTLLECRGRGSMREELRELQSLLGNAENIVQDSTYCTGREEKLTHLVDQLEPLLGDDASAQLLHPLKGEALRQALISELEEWDD